MFNSSKETPTSGEMKRWLKAIGVRKGKNVLFSRDTEPANLQYVGRFDRVKGNRQIVIRVGYQYYGDRRPLEVHVEPSSVRTLSDHGDRGYVGQPVTKK